MTESNRHAGITRVAFLLPTLEVGGAERVVLRTATGLDRARFEPTVIGIVRGTGSLICELDAARVQTVVLDEGVRPRPRQIHRLFKWLRGNAPDVLVTYMFHANIAGRLMRRLGAVPAVVSSERAVGLDSMWRVLVDRHTVAWADAITVNSISGLRFWAQELRIPESRLSVIYNGVDTAAYAPVPPSTRPLIGVLARLQPPNGHDWLLDALADLDRLAPEPWTCTLAGTGPEESRLRARTERLRLTHRVEFAGHVADPVSFLRSLMVCVHPALYSGMPNAVLEAMACGLPVVATAVGGTPEAIEHGKTGWLVKPGDTGAAARLLAELLRNPELRMTAGLAARTRVIERFSLTGMVTASETLLTQVLDAHA